MKTIKVLVKEAYGVRRYYPDCPAARAVCGMTGRKTLLESDLAVLRDLGHEIQAVSPLGNPVPINVTLNEETR